VCIWQRQLLACTSALLNIELCFYVLPGQCTIIHKRETHAAFLRPDAKIWHDFVSKCFILTPPIPFYGFVFERRALKGDFDFMFNLFFAMKN